MTKEEIYQEIKRQILIVDYAARLGFTVVRKGKYFSLKEHDSVIIDPYKNCFWRNSKCGNGSSIGRGGSIIDFVLEFTNLSLHEVLKQLSSEILGTTSKTDFVGSKEQKRNYTGGLELPEADSNMHNVYAYLIKTRKIAPEIVQLLVERKQLYQDQMKNCVFVSYDQAELEKPVFACKRGTNTFKPFYGDVPGCDYTQCFYIDQKSEEIFITESVIDALSVMTLRPDVHWNFLALAGVGKIECLSRYLTNAIKTVRIGTDNDLSGKNAALEMKQIIENEKKDIQIIFDFPPEGWKDWNEFLQNKGGIEP